MKAHWDSPSEEEEPYVLANCENIFNFMSIFHWKIVTVVWNYGNVILTKTTKQFASAFKLIEKSVFFVCIQFVQSFSAYRNAKTPSVAIHQRMAIAEVIFISRTNIMKSTIAPCNWNDNAKFTIIVPWNTRHAFALSIRFVWQDNNAHSCSSFSFLFCSLFRCFWFALFAFLSHVALNSSLANWVFKSNHTHNIFTIFESAHTHFTTNYSVYWKHFMICEHTNHLPFVDECCQQWKQCNEFRKKTKKLPKGAMK